MILDYSVDADGVCTLTWNVEGRPVNVMNSDTMAAFEEAIDRALADKTVKGVVVASAKADFVAGADLDQMLTDRSAEELMAEFSTLDRVTRKMERGVDPKGKGPIKPFCAAINGHALGGGFEIALGCHRRIAADNPKTRVGLPEVKLGLLPGGGGTQRIGRMLGIQKALEMLLDGRHYPVAKALEMGIVDEIVPPDELLAAAKAWVLANPDATQPWDRKGFRVPGPGVQSQGGLMTFLGANSMTRAKTLGNWPAAQAILSCVYEGLQLDIDTGLRLESRYLTQMVLDKRTKNIIRTTFFAMGDARKAKNRPKDVPKATYGKIGILGAGMMGAGIAYVSARAGIDVALLDTTEELAAKGKGKSEELVGQQVSKGRMAEDTGSALLDRIAPTTDFADLAGSDLVIEAVIENRDVKADVTKKTEAVLAPEAIFASNTSTLPITGLATASERPANFIGLHFFSPVHRMPLVEVIRAEKTSDETLARALDYVLAIGMTPIVVNDSRGFYTSRVFSTFVLEGFAMLREGVKPALIENAAKLAGMPVGPLDVTDAGSLSLFWHILQQSHKDLGDKHVTHPGEQVIEYFVETLDRPGKKAGKGFYEYPADGPKRLWPEINAHYPLLNDQPDVEEVKKRFLHIQSLETVRCFDEGVVTTRQDADVGSVLGWGFPLYTGGTASYVRLVGAETMEEDCKALAGKHGERFQPPANFQEIAERIETAA